MSKSKDSLTTFCTIEGCGKPRRARTLCASHYNAKYRKPNPTVTATCDSCGAEYQKEKRTVERYSNGFCSRLCRDHYRYGATTCALPVDHWARWYGKTSEWKPPFVRNTGTCAWCEQGNPRGLSSSYCSPSCRTKAKRVRRNGKLHNAPGVYTYGQLVRLWVGFGKACAYCRTRTPLSAIQAEHVHPLSKGGANHLGNLLPSCMPCNADKRDLLLDEWNSDRKRRNLPVVVTEWDDADPRYSHLDRTPVRMSA